MGGAKIQSSESRAAAPGPAVRAAIRAKTSRATPFQTTAHSLRLKKEGSPAAKNGVQKAPNRRLPPLALEGLVGGEIVAQLLVQGVRQETKLHGLLAVCPVGVSQIRDAVDHIAARRRNQQQHKT